MALIAAISDTHLPRGGRHLPASCVEQLCRADLILHAGDLTSVSFLDELRSLGPAVQAIHGNVDEPRLREELPDELVIEAGSVRIAMIHIPGPRIGREQRLIMRFPGCAAVLYGHTHLPQVELHEDVWILNPGSPTERRRAPHHSMLLLEIDSSGSIRPELLQVE